MSRRPRIGIHCPGTGRGGPWRYVHSLLRHIDTREFNVSIICDLHGEYEPRREIHVVPLSPPGASNEAPAAAAVETNLAQREPRFKPLRVMAGFAQSARRLARTLAPLRLDLFHTQNTGCEEAPVAARLAGIPCRVGTFHTDHTYDLHGERSGLHYQVLERISNRSLHRAIAVSQATGRNWRRRTFIPRHRVVTIHNGITAADFHRRQAKADARQSLDLPQDAFIVLGLGRLDEAKGFADLIDAVAMLRPEHPHLLAVIAGEGPLLEPLRMLAEYRQANVRLLGFQADVLPLLAATDAFALPSLCEACPYAVLEAMAAGLPVIASDVGGVQELLGETGLALPPRNAPRLANAMHTLIERPELRAELGTAAAGRVAVRFDEAAMAARTFEVYRSLLRSKGH